MTFVNFSRRLNLVLLLCISSINIPIASAYQIIKVTDYKTLKAGCYRFTDVVVVNSDENFSTSALPPAYLGKLAMKVNCDLLHHLEISQNSSTSISGNQKADALKLRVQCLKNNISRAVSGHSRHSSQMFFKLWRVNGMNNWVCGVIAKNQPLENAQGFIFYEVFYGRVLNSEARK